MDFDVQLTWVSYYYSDRHTRSKASTAQHSSVYIGLDVSELLVRRKLAVVLVVLGWLVSRTAAAIGLEKAFPLFPLETLLLFLRALERVLRCSFVQNPFPVLPLETLLLVFSAFKLRRWEAGDGTGSGRRNLLV